MKRILYLNKDTLLSYMSQIDDGLVKNKKESKEKNVEKSFSTTASVDAEASLNLKVFGKGVDAGIEPSIDSSKQNKYLNSNVDSIEKEVFDESVEKFEKYLLDNDYLNTNGDIGDFIKIEEAMYIVDLEYYKNIFSNNSLLDYIKKNEIETKLSDIEQDIGETGNGKKAAYDKEKMYREIKKAIDEEYNEISRNIDVVLNIVPYNKFGIMGDYLISLDDEYFRDKTEVVAFKYGGKMTLIGHVTNVVNSNVNGADENIFNIFPSIINTFMLTFFHKTEIKIVHPIAIYY